MTEPKDSIRLRILTTMPGLWVGTERVELTFRPLIVGGSGQEPLRGAGDHRQRQRGDHDLAHDADD